MALKKPTTKTKKQPPKTTKSKLVKPNQEKTSSVKKEIVKQPTTSSVKKELDWSEMSSYLKNKNTNHQSDISSRRYLNI